MGSKKLLDKVGIQGKFGAKSVPQYLRSDPEVSSWLSSLFGWIKSGQVLITFEDIATELSEFSERDISGDHISRAYRQWIKSGKY